MSESLSQEELMDRLLLIATLNATLMHFLLSTQIEGRVDPDRVDSLTQGLKRTRKWIESTLAPGQLSQSTANIMGLIVKRLSQIESLLPKLAYRAQRAEQARTPTMEILTLLDDGRERPPAEVVPEGAQLSRMTPAPSPDTVPPLTLVEAAPEEPEEPYLKAEIEDDAWGFIGQHQRMIEQYSVRCHVLLPVFWLEVLKEIHRYRSKSPYFADVVETPSRFIVRIIKGLLTEAPGARLLQELHQKRPQEKDLLPSEKARIERAVASYFAGVEEVLRGGEVNVQEKILEAQAALDGFDWGGPDLEKRIIKRFNQRCEEAVDSASSDSDDTRRVIYAETAKLLCKIQLGILAEPRLREVLAQMKP